jgi:citrate lyase subunit beta/citryl-CoA lyase
MRSLLFVPGDSERKLQRGLDSGADALILDLEDSVALAQKDVARQQVANFLNAHSVESGQRYYVRINPYSAGVVDKDLGAVVACRPSGIMLPKSEPELVRSLSAALDKLEAQNDLPAGGIGIIAITMETPQAVFGMGMYAGSSRRLTALTYGAEDLAAALGSVTRSTDGYEDTYRLTRTVCLLGAGAASVDAIDTVFADYKNLHDFKAECIAARRSGFSGKLAIHPDQVAIINEVFTPTAQEIAWARRVDEAFSANPDLGTLGIDGKMIDKPHWLLAQRLLSRL